MVPDGIYYASGLVIGGLVVVWLSGLPYAVPFFLIAAFCLYFFRDPERESPSGPVSVSPADGKIVAVKQESGSATRISIFLNIFDVHVNRSPIAGRVSAVEYRKGEFLVASKEEASAQNEMNTVTVEGNGSCVVFKQIAGLIARRIIFNKQVGDTVNTGER